MYEYYIITIFDGHNDKKIVKIDENCVYFDNNYISDYMILNEEKIKVKRFQNMIFNNKKMYKYDINKITIKEHLPDIHIVSYLCDFTNDFKIEDNQGNTYKDFHIVKIKKK